MTARIGGPIALIVVGLVLRYAIADRLSGVNLQVVGLIAVAAGILWLLLELLVNRPRSQVTRESTTVQATTPAQDEHIEREVRREEI